MQVSVERDKCEGHGVCHMVEPELFPLDDLGYSALEDADIEPGDEDRVRRAVASCPERALSVREP